MACLVVNIPCWLDNNGHSDVTCHGASYVTYIYLTGSHIFPGMCTILMNPLSLTVKHRWRHRLARDLLQSTTEDALYNTTWRDSATCCRCCCRCCGATRRSRIILHPFRKGKMNGSWLDCVLIARMYRVCTESRWLRFSICHETYINHALVVCVCIYIYIYTHTHTHVLILISCVDACLCECDLVMGSRPEIRTRTVCRPSIHRRRPLTSRGHR